MPNELPAFLQEFINTRKKLSKSHEPTPIEKAKIRKGETKPVEGALESGMQYIIDNKPGRKHMEEYLQKRCDEWTAAKMAKA